MQNKSDRTTISLPRALFLRLKERQKERGFVTLPAVVADLIARADAEEACLARISCLKNEIENPTSSLLKNGEK